MSLTNISTTPAMVTTTPTLEGPWPTGTSRALAAPTAPRTASSPSWLMPRPPTTITTACLRSPAGAAWTGPGRTRHCSEALLPQGGRARTTGPWSLLGALGKGFGLLGHHRAKPGVLCSHRGQGALPDAKALWPSPSSKAGMLLGAQEGCPSFWGIPSSALESGVQQHPANVRFEFPLEGGKAGMGEGKILVKVHELCLGSGGGIAA